MADKEKYVIKVEGKMIEVSQDVYYAYFRMERQERWQEEKRKKHNILSYDALDTSETVGEDTIADMVSPSVEEITIANDIRNRLHHAVAALPKAERELIQAIYFDGVSEREYAVLRGITQTGVNKQRRKILSKMKSFLNLMGSFDE